ncbi:hypothetical protein GCM10009651_20590 [Microbacterium natoriense]
MRARRSERNYQLYVRFHDMASQILDQFRMLRYWHPLPCSGEGQDHFHEASTDSASATRSAWATVLLNENVTTKVASSLLR